MPQRCFRRTLKRRCCHHDFKGKHNDPKVEFCESSRVAAAAGAVVSRRRGAMNDDRASAPASLCTIAVRVADERRALLTLDPATTLAELLALLPGEGIEATVIVPAISAGARLIPDRAEQIKKVAMVAGVAVLATVTCVAAMRKMKK